MAGNIRLEVVTPDKLVVDEDVQIVVAPGEMGEFGVLPGHTTFLTFLRIGTLRYKDAGGAERYVFINGGFAEALPDKVTVLAESAEKSQDIDIERAKAAFERAQRRLSEKQENIDYTRAKASLQRALQRIRMIDTTHM